MGYCVGNIGGTIEDQINGAFDNMEKRLALVGLTLESVAQMDCLFRDVWNIPVMEKIIKERFGGKYPVQKYEWIGNTRRAAPEKLKTVIRHPIKVKG